MISLYKSLYVDYIDTIKNRKILKSEFPNCSIPNKIRGDFILSYEGQRVFPLVFYRHENNPNVDYIEYLPKGNIPPQQETSFKIDLCKENSFCVFTELYILSLLDCKQEETSTVRLVSIDINIENIIEEHPADINKLIKSFKNSMEKFGHNIKFSNMFESLDDIFCNKLTNKDLFLYM